MMTTILSVLASAIIMLALAVVAASLYSVFRFPNSPKKFLRIYDACAAVYILCIYVLLAAGVLSIGEFPALLARVGFIVLLGLFIAEIIADLGTKWMQH